jgi:hypothetical protein
MDVKGIGNRDYTVGGRSVIGSIVGYKHGAGLSEYPVVVVIVYRNHADVRRIVGVNGTVVTTGIGIVAVMIRDKGSIIIGRVAIGIRND